MLHTISYIYLEQCHLQLTQSDDKDMAWTNGQATVSEQSKVVNGPATGPAHSRHKKHNFKSKVPRPTKFASQMLNIGCLNDLTPSNNCRYDSSLGMVRLDYKQL